MMIAPGCATATRSMSWSSTSIFVLNVLPSPRSFVPMSISTTCGFRMPADHLRMFS